MLKYLLDTNTLIYTINNAPNIVRNKFNTYDGMLCISTVTLGELIYGAEKSTKTKSNLAAIEGLCARLDVLSFDEHAAANFGQIRHELKSKGQPIGPYDMMIAGHARSLGLILVTNNTKEFSRVEGLRLENWV